MPSFTFCPQCNTKYRTAGMPAFKRLRCKKCQGIFVVPEDSAEQSLAATPDKKPDAQPNSPGNKRGRIRGTIAAHEGRS